MDGNTIPERPPKVTAAVYVLYVSLAITAISLFLPWSLGGISSIEASVVLVLLLVVAAIIGMIWQGKNWARITFLILVLLGTPISTWSVIQTLGSAAFFDSLSATLVVEITTTILDVVAVVFLFQRDSSDWFKAMKEMPRQMPSMNGPGMVTSESPATWKPDGAEHKIKYAQLWVRKYGLTAAGTIGADSETVCLVGPRIQGYLLAVFLIPCVSFLNKMVGVWLGVYLKLIPLIIICVAVMLILHFKWKLFNKSTFYVQKRLITSVTRQGKKVRFCLPDPKEMGGPPVNVSVKAKSEEEAQEIESELRSS